MKRESFPLVDVLGLLMGRIVIPNGPEHKAGIEGRERLLVFLTGEPIPVGGVPEAVVERHREDVRNALPHLDPTGAFTLEFGTYLLTMEDMRPADQRYCALGWLSLTKARLGLPDAIELTSYA